MTVEEIVPHVDDELKSFAIASVQSSLVICGGYRQQSCLTECFALNTQGD